MSAVITADGEYPSISRAQSIGTTRQAERLAAMLREATSHARKIQTDWRTRAHELIEIVALENSSHGWNGYSARPISPDAKRYAQLFVDNLPFGLPAPDALPDPDGDIALCWDFGPGHILTLTFSPDGTINYAGILGGGVKRHGVEPFCRDMPKVLLESIEELRDRAAYTG